MRQPTCHGLIATPLFNPIDGLLFSCQAIFQPTEIIDQVSSIENAHIEQKQFRLFGGDFFSWSHNIIWFPFYARHSSLLGITRLSCSKFLVVPGCLQPLIGRMRSHIELHIHKVGAANFLVYFTCMVGRWCTQANNSMTNLYFYRILVQKVNRPSSLEENNFIISGISWGLWQRLLWTLSTV
jgi:hypothetical protein